MTTTDLARDAMILKARDLSGIAHELNADRLDAFIEIFELLEAQAASTVAAPSAPRWSSNAQVVTDRDGEKWDRLTDGRYRLRGGSCTWSASHVEAECGPIKVAIVNPMLVPA